MTPTPEQVAVWAREAGVGEFNDMNLYEQMALYKLVTRAMAEQAEADAKDLKRAKDECDAITELNHAQWLALENVRLLAARCRNESWAQDMLRFCNGAGVTAAAIRANAPKVTT